VGALRGGVLCGLVFWLVLVQTAIQLAFTHHPILVKPGCMLPSIGLSLFLPPPPPPLSVPCVATIWPFRPSPPTPNPAPPPLQPCLGAT
jgi:hypothetical protein